MRNQLPGKRSSWLAHVLPSRVRAWSLTVCVRSVRALKIAAPRTVETSELHTQTQRATVSERKFLTEQKKAFVVREGKGVGREFTLQREYCPELAKRFVNLFAPEAEEKDLEDFEKVGSGAEGRVDNQWRLQFAYKIANKVKKVNGQYDYVVRLNEVRR